MHLPLIWAALITVSMFASTPVLADANEQATLLLEEKPHHPLALNSVSAPQFFDPATWTVSLDGARATAQFEILGRAKGSIGFLAEKTLASPSRAMVIRLDLLDPANDPIVNVFVPSVDALEYPTGPRLKGVTSRRDDKTFDVHLDEAEAAANVKAIGVGRTIDVAFRLRSRRIGRMSIDHDAAGAPAPARDEDAYEINLSDERPRRTQRRPCSETRHREPRPQPCATASQRARAKLRCVKLNESCSTTFYTMNCS
jgi:hypothetical protein